MLCCYGCRDVWGGVVDHQLPTMIKRLALCLAVLALILARTSAQSKSEKSLYQRIGGYDVIASVVDDWFARQAKDQRFTRFLAVRSITSRRKGRQQVVDFLCEATGGPCFYSGKDMRTAHAGLGITEDVWQGQIDYLIEALDKCKVPAKEKQEFVDVVSSFRSAVVETRPPGRH